MVAFYFWQAWVLYLLWMQGSWYDLSSPDSSRLQKVSVLLYESSLLPYCQHVSQNCRCMGVFIATVPLKIRVYLKFKSKQQGVWIITNWDGSKYVDSNFRRYNTGIELDGLWDPVEGVSLFMAAEDVMMVLPVFSFFLWEAYEIACFCEQKNLIHNLHWLLIWRLANR